MLQTSILSSSLSAPLHTYPLCFTTSPQPFIRVLPITLPLMVALQPPAESPLISNSNLGGKYWPQHPVSAIQSCTLRAYWRQKRDSAESFHFTRSSSYIRVSEYDLHVRYIGHASLVTCMRAFQRIVTQVSSRSALENIGTSCLHRQHDCSHQHYNMSVR